MQVQYESIFVVGIIIIIIIIAVLQHYICHW